LKQKRVDTIVEIMSSELIYSQEELLKKLEEKGISCTQATLSRNLRQIGVVKVPDSQGRMVYKLKAADNIHQDNREHGIRAEMVLSVLWANEQVLIKTLPGYAAAIASAIDKADPPEIAGTIAGDDTVLVIPHDKTSRESINSRIEVIFS
jgi:transcriptional regulator of arginine metabolism